MRIYNESDQDTTIEFNVDQGARGVPGLPGPPGKPGDAATSSQVHISQAADMDMQGAVAGHFMRYDGSTFVLANMVLDDHLDVNVEAPNPGDALVWNGTAWIPGSVSGGSGVYVLKGGDTMTGILDMTSHKVVNVTNPTNPQEAATKAYVDTTVIASGSLILSGTGVPGAGTGVDGNYYVDTTNKALYGPKAGSTWPLNIKGLPAAGSTNQVLSKTSSTDYATAWGNIPASSLILTDDHPPTEVNGVSGNYYNDNLNGVLYGPRALVSFGPRTYQASGTPTTGNFSSPGTGIMYMHHMGTDVLDYKEVMERYLTIDSKVKFVTAGRTFIATVTGVSGMSGSWNYATISLSTWPLPVWTAGESAVSNLYDNSTGDAHWPVTVRPQRLVPTDVPGTPYILQAADENKFMYLNNGTAMTVQLPSNSAVSIPLGATFDFLWYGVGQPSFAAGSGAAVQATPGLKMRARYAVCTAMKYLTNTWVVYGDLAA